MRACERASERRDRASCFPYSFDFRARSCVSPAHLSMTVMRKCSHSSVEHVARLINCFIVFSEAAQMF